MFESGVKDYVHFPITVDVSFPISRKGEALVYCEYCKMFTGRKCVLTHEVILDAQHYVGNDCPLKEEK